MLKFILHLTLLPIAATASGGEAGSVVTLNVHPDQVERTVDISRLIGGNVALWHEPTILENEETLGYMQRWKPGILRMPGGSWSDEFYWNGNGIRKGDHFDHTKLRDGRWEVDYSDYAPGFRVASIDGDLSDFHGNSDIKSLHEFIRRQGAETIVTVNVGTGTPEMAAEWVRWANLKQGYAVRYWEIGNELDGEWELGHFGREAKPMTAEAYANRFLAYAKAMKAVDPTIKIGGAASSSDELPFTESLIRKAGDQLDFISFHTYPVLGGRRSEAQRFAQANDVGLAIRRIRDWIKRDHPERVGNIEIGVTEWHKQVMENRPTVDLSSGIWACLFVGALADAGADFANQWDLFSTTPNGGHGLFGKIGGSGPRATFHALTLWGEHMHSDLLKVDGKDPSLHVFATRNDDELAVMLINTSSRQPRSVALNIAGNPARGRAEGYRFSQREYFWNPHRNAPEWSIPPSATRIDFTATGGLEVPPLSALVIKLPLDRPATASPLPADPGEAELIVLLPASAPSDLPVEGFVSVRKRGSTLPWPGKMDALALSLDGPGKLNAKQVSANQGIASFLLTPSTPGKTTVRVTGGGLSTTHQISWTQIRERPEVVWTFSDDSSLSGMNSNYALALDRQVRPNQSVAAVSLDRSLAIPQKNSLLEITQFPASIPKKRIGGVTALLSRSPDFTCDDPRASVEIVAQSNLDHWILLQRVPLKELAGVWKPLKVRLTDPAVLEAMPELYSVRFQLKTDSPVTGRIYLDDIGFILRAPQKP